MQTSRCSVQMTLLTAALLAGATVSAQTSVDRSFEPSPRNCADVRWSETVLQAFPSIGEACQAVEQRHGKTYVKLEGTVEEVRDGGKRIQVDFKDGSVLTFTPTRRTMLYMDGERTEFEDLQRGTELNFYIPEDRLQAELKPDPNRLAFVIVPIEITPAPFPSRNQSVARTERDAQRSAAAELPETAGPLPLMGLGGLVLLITGATITIVRKTRARR
jgi:hypothetical protein